ncbi:MAG: iron ABC transporter permease [Candidatus Heimdallarchaeota archaeon]|nr:iron ABC transporter permease [Candidatus Heimdallarchaeota archaeon]
MVTATETVSVKKETFKERFARADKLTAGFVVFSYLFFGIFLILPVVLILYASLANSIESDTVLGTIIRTDVLNLVLSLITILYIIIPTVFYRIIVQRYKTEQLELLGTGRTQETISPIYKIVTEKKIKWLIGTLWIFGFIIMFLAFFGEAYLTIFQREELWGGRAFGTSNVGFSEAFLAEPLSEQNPNFPGIIGTKWIIQGPDFGAIGNSLFVATGTTILSLLIGAGLALVMARYKFAGKTFLRSIMLLPLIIPPFVGTIGFDKFLGINGIINDNFLFPMFNIKMVFGGNIGIMIVQTLHFYTLVYLNSYSSLVNIDPSLEEQAENMGANNFTLLRKITMPLAIPGIAAGAILTFILSLEDLGTPLIFRGLQQALDFEYMTTYVLNNLQIPSLQGYFIINPIAAALAAIMVIIAMIGFLIIRQFVSLRRYAMISKGRVGEPRAQDASLVKRVIIYIFFIIFMPIALIPHVGTFLFAVTKPGTGEFTLDPFLSILGISGDLGEAIREKIITSIINMFWYSVVATFLIIIIATIIAYILARKDFPGKGLLDTIVTLPLAIPGIVIGFGYLYIFYTETLPFPLNLMEPTTFNAFQDYLGSVIANPAILLGGTIPILDAILNLLQILAFPMWLLNLIFYSFTKIELSMNPAISPVLLLILAYTVRKFPFTVRAAYAGMSQTDIALEEAALNLGASRIKTITKITLPIVALSLFAGSLISLVYCMSEVSTTILLVDFVPDPGRFATSTWTIYDIYNSGLIGQGAPLAAVLGLILMTVQSISILITSVGLKSQSEALTGI